MTKLEKIYPKKEELFSGNKSGLFMKEGKNVPSLGWSKEIGLIAKSKSTSLAYLVKKEHNKVSFSLSKDLCPTCSAELKEDELILFNKDFGMIAVCIKNEMCVFKLKKDNLNKLNKVVNENYELVKKQPSKVKELREVNTLLVKELINSLKNSDEETNPLGLDVKKIKTKELSFTIPIRK
jgi:hypothetical protein